MELNNTIDPNTGLPKLPDNLHWLVNAPNKMYPPSIWLRKDNGVQYVTRKVENSFWRNIFFMPKLTVEAVDRNHQRFETLATKSLNPFVYKRPEDDEDYTYYAISSDRNNRNIYPKDMTEWWFKTDVDAEMIKSAAEELWDTYIVNQHKQAIAETLFGMFPPKKIGD